MASEIYANPHGFVDRLDNLLGYHMDWMQRLRMTAFVTLYHTNQADISLVANKACADTKLLELFNRGIPVVAEGWCDGDGKTDAQGLADAAKKYGCVGIVPNIEIAHKFETPGGWQRTQDMFGELSRYSYPICVSTLARLDVEIYNDVLINTSGCWIATQSYFKDFPNFAEPVKCVQSAYQLPLDSHRDDGRPCRVSFDWRVNNRGIVWCRLNRVNGEWRIKDGQNLWRYQESTRRVYNLVSGTPHYVGVLLGVAARSRLTTTLQSYNGATGDELVESLKYWQPRPWGIYTVESSTQDQRDKLERHAIGT